MKFKLTLLLIIGNFLYGYTQISNNTLFIIVDKESNRVETNYNERVKIKYTVWNETKNWYALFHHYNQKGDKTNHVKYLLPREVFNEYRKKGNILSSEEFEQMVYPLNVSEFDSLIELRYPTYYYEYVDDGVTKNIKRNGIYLIFKSDLNEEYIECSEVSMIVDLLSHD